MIPCAVFVVLTLIIFLVGRYLKVNFTVNFVPKVAIILKVMYVLLMCLVVVTVVVDFLSISAVL